MVVTIKIVVIEQLDIGIVNPEVIPDVLGTYRS